MKTNAAASIRIAQSPAWNASSETWGPSTRVSFRLTRPLAIDQASFRVAPNTPLTHRRGTPRISSIASAARAAVRPRGTGIGVSLTSRTHDRRRSRCCHHARNAGARDSACSRNCLACWISRLAKLLRLCSASASAADAGRRRASFARSATRSLANWRRAS